MAELSQAHPHESSNELPMPEGQAAPEVQREVDEQAEENKASLMSENFAGEAAADHSNVELEGKIGEYGDYSVDLRPSGDVVSVLNLGIQKAFFGFLTVEGAGKVSVTADLLGGLLALAEKSNKSWLVGIAQKLRSVSGR